MANPSPEIVPASAATAREGNSYLDWSAVLGGTVIAIALSLVLLRFGAGIGLAVGPAVLADGTTSWNVIIASLWIVLVALASATAGGYIAGRMRPRLSDAVESEVEFRDGTHGLAVWGASTLGIALLAETLITQFGMVISTAVSTGTVADRITFNIATIYAFGSAVAAALGAGGAWFGGTLGGEHRDQGLSVHALVPRVFRRKPTA